MKQGLFLTLGLIGICGRAQALPAASDVTAHNSITRCEALANADFSSIPGAPTDVTSATFVPADKGLPDHCLVRGYIAPQVGFELRLPSENWNKKLIEIGCGGHCGVILSSYGNPDDQDCDGSLRQGYACIGSNMGHQGTMFDALWGFNNLQGRLDWGYRATHVAALTGKAITKYFYNEAAKKSYFWGCSTGGRQALQEAQRFPWDFDGIIAGAPPVNLSTVYLGFAWNIRRTHDANGKPLLGHADLKLLTDAVLAKCDRNDGVKDGIIDDPRHCGFDPATLTCRPKQTQGCLTSSQVAAVKAVYAGPTTSQGLRLSHGGPMRGSEENWSAYISEPPLMEHLIESGLRYLFFAPEGASTWKLRDFDFDHDYKRLETMEPLYDSSNPDLRSFKAAGGKLIAFQGLSDTSVLPEAIEDYYETVERTMGGQDATEEFFRLFELPGVSHCAGGTGADRVDFLGALENWVENGKAPERLIAARTKDQGGFVTPRFPLDPDKVEFTRPVFPYPIRIKYRGRGDPNDAGSFIPVGH